MEKAGGDVADSRDWKVDGVVDQVAGGAQHSYGRARSIAENAIDSPPDIAEQAMDRVKATSERVADSAQKDGRVAGWRRRPYRTAPRSGRLPP